MIKKNSILSAAIHKNSLYQMFHHQSSFMCFNPFAEYCIYFPQVKGPCSLRQAAAKGQASFILWSKVSQKKKSRIKILDQFSSLVWSKVYVRMTKFQTTLQASYLEAQERRWSKILWLNIQTIHRIQIEPHKNLYLLDSFKTMFIVDVHLSF